MRKHIDKSKFYTRDLAIQKFYESETNTVLKLQLFKNEYTI